MTSLETLQRTIDGAEAETQKILDALAAAQDPAEVVLLRDKLRVMQERLGEFEKRMTLLLEQQTLVLRSQASGGHWLRSINLEQFDQYINLPSLACSRFLAVGLLVFVKLLTTSHERCATGS